MARKKTRKDGNNEVQDATWRSILGAKAFRIGYEDKLAGKAFDPDRFRDGRDQWNYERGRLLACSYSGPLKDSKRVTLGAIYAAKRLYIEKSFI